MIRALRDGDDPAKKIAELFEKELDHALGLTQMSTNISAASKLEGRCSERPYISISELKHVWREVSAFIGGGENPIGVPEREEFPQKLREAASRAMPQVLLGPEDESVIQDALWILETQGEVFSSGGLSTFASQRCRPPRAISSLTWVAFHSQFFLSLRS